jgi:hypothetical protein
MAAQRIGDDIAVMKKIKLFALTGTAVVALGSTAWAGPHSGGGGLAGGGHFGGNQFGGHSGGLRAAPAFSAGGARFSGNRSIGPLSRTPQQFYYYSGARPSGVTSHASARQMPNRSINPNAGRVAAVNRQPNRVDSTVGQKRVSDPRLSTAANRQSLIKDHAFARQDANWHHDWDRHHAHFHKGHVFVFIDGFWWGLYPWDYYTYYADDYYPYDYYDYDYYPYGYDDQSAYVDSDPYGSSSTVSAVQSELAKLGYYRGTIDGVAGDETQAALARYQQDHDLSVTGTLTAATLQSLGLARNAG